MSSKYSSSNVSLIPLEQCFENLRQSILQVIHHEQVSDEVRSFLTELVQAVLQYAEQTNGSSSGTRSGASAVRPTSPEMDPWFRNQKVGDPIEDHSIRLDSMDQSGVYRLKITPRTGAIQVINSVTGKILTLSQEDLIRWAEQQGIDPS